MHYPVCYQNCNEYPRRQVAINLQRMVLVAVCVLGTISYHHVLAQSKPAGSGESPLCTRDNAFDMIKQQVDLTKTFNNTNQRITVLIRAADLLWPYKQDGARAVFTEAFELATENEKENEQKGPRSVVLRMQNADQRYVVIRAVAKRDSAWAKELTRQMLKPDVDGEVSSTRDSFQDVLTAERLLDSARQLISTDINAAFDLARTSLRYPASTMLTRFLYRLAEINQQAADQFYLQALAVYADKPMREFLYLHAYPFASRESLDTPIFASYVVPSNFVRNQSLQRRFVEVLLRRALQVLEVPLDPGDTYRDPTGALLSGTAHLLHTLMRLEPPVRTSLPDLSAPLTQAREKVLVSLSPETQRRLLQPGQEIFIPSEKTLDEQIELAQKAPDVNRRDELIATIVLSAASDKPTLATVIEVIDKISDSNVRVALREWIYFRRATTAIKDKEFEEAEKLALQVEGLEQRAYLYTEIARALLNSNETQTRAREVLDTAVTQAKKAGKTIFAARSLLTASNLYAKIDVGRSIAILADAVDRINHIDAPDFAGDDQTLVKVVQKAGRPGQYLLRFPMPGLDPQSAFREMAKIDFDNALSQSSALTDKLQRAMSTLALAEACLQQALQPPKEKPMKGQASIVAITQIVPPDINDM